MKMIFLVPRGGTPSNYPPIGVLYLSSIAKQKGLEVSFYDAGAIDNSDEGMFEYAKKIQPDIIGFTVFTFKASMIFGAIRKMKKELPNAKIIVGGPHICAIPERTMMECGEIDFAVVGEGELTFAEWLDCVISGNNDYSHINGLLYRKDGDVRVNPMRETIRNLDDLPPMDLELMKGMAYEPDGASLGKKIGSFMSSRGCPFRCSFCHQVFPGAYRRRSVKKVVDDIETLVKKYNCDELFVADYLFGVNKEWLDEFYAELKKRNIKVPWKGMGRVNTLSAEDLKKMKENGCYSINFGIESGNTEVLKDIRKQISLDVAEEKVKVAKDLGIAVFAFFILGHRLDTMQTMQETLDFSMKINPHFVAYNQLNPFPGTELFDLVPESEEKYNWDKFADVLSVREKHNTYPPSICGLKPEEISKFRAKCYEKFFSSNRYFVENVLLTGIPFKLRWLCFKHFIAYRIPFLRKLRLLLKNVFIVTDT